MLNASTFGRVLRSLIAAVALLLISVPSGQAQNFVNGTTGEICNTGTIKFTSNTGSMVNSNASLTTTSMTTGNIMFTGTNNSFTGTNPLGANPSFPVPGTVIYSTTSGVQNVTAAYYTNLTETGGANINIPDNVHVQGVYSPLGNTGTRTYVGTFYYDGQGGTQNVATETTNPYNNVSLGGAGTHTVTGSTIVNGSLASSTPLVVSGGTFDLGTTSDFSGNVTVSNATIQVGTGTTYFGPSVIATVNNDGSLSIPGGSGIVTVATSSTLNLNSNTTNALVMASGTQLVVSGGLTNTGTSSSLNLDCSSIVLYNGIGAQQLMATSLANPYGILRVTNGTVAKQGGGNIAICSDYLLADQNLNMLTYTLTMLAPTGVATYLTDAETVGNMTRIMTTGTNSYVLNNAETRINFTGGTTPTSMNWFNSPVTSPFNYDATTDINRKSTVTYTGSTDFVGTLRVGYKASTEKDLTFAWAENTLRQYENNATSAEKLATGLVRTNFTTATLAYVEVPGVRATSAIVSPNGLKYLASGQDVLLRGGPTTFNAIADGRWSNPGTWDEGIQPSPVDYAVIDGFQVWTGFRRSTNGTAGTIADNWSTSETYSNQLAARITIENHTPIDPTRPSALIFGGWNISLGDLQNNMTGVNASTISPTNSFSTPAGVQIINKQLAGTCPTATYAGLNALAIDDVTRFGGIVNFEGATIHTYDLLNTGTIANGGTFEVGAP